MQNTKHCNNNTAVPFAFLASAWRFPAFEAEMLKQMLKHCSFRWSTIFHHLEIEKVKKKEELLFQQWVCEGELDMG